MTRNASSYALFVCPECRKSHGIDLALLCEKSEKGKEQGSPCIGCGHLIQVQDGIPKLLKSETQDGSGDGDCTIREEVLTANIAFHDRTAKTYELDLSTEGIKTERCQERIRRVIQHAASTSQGQSMLDVGCGTGNILSYAGDYFPQCVGVDVSMGMLAEARGRGFAVATGDAYHLPLSDESVDCVTAFSVLHHLFDYPSFLTEAARVLRPGGLLYTDYDPSAEGRRVVANSSLATLSRNILGVMRSFRGKLLSRKVTAHDDLKDLVQKAEYHLYLGSGIDETEVAASCYSAGFKEVRTVLHWNSRSYEGAALHDISFEARLLRLAKSVLTLSLDHRRIAPLLLTLARKP